MLKKTLVAGMAFLMLSCGNQKKEEGDSGSGSVIDKVSNLNKMANSADKMEELSAKLKKLTPLTNDELKAAVPETLDGLKRKSFSAGGYAVAGMSTIEAEYGDDAKYVKVGIIDGAGESGSAIISLMAMTLSMDRESESNGTVSKNVDVNGIRSITEETKSENSISSSIKFLYKDRYSVNLDGTQYTLQELETFLKSLKLDQLK
ncbi:hypothetical protein CPT03_19150 [Pedobacter ginsengisoli]|uniref:Uncharacterized protein n=1 Tax=Pedobacter ginsengisoli TaxID=363852 RepID=A0A2D1U9X7_9SPHI|nr:hypothetical protein [Pedobacter ginsengisoli]ATP58427.1 hypothetical protein CPT03_19150 [Pedobacter ginsengisoli]